MKTTNKLMITLIALGVTLSAQAASISWQASGAFAGSANDLVLLIRTSNGNAAPTLTANGAALVLAGGYDLLGAATLDGSGILTLVTVPIAGTTQWSTSNPLTVQNLNLLPGNTGGDALPTTVAGQNSGSGNKRDYYMVVFNASTFAGATTYSLDALTGRYPATASTSLPLSFDPASLGSPNPIPEPATMALFGIGAAVIGLRRKFRKS